jgi:hypothetical protein
MTPSPPPPTAIDPGLERRLAVGIHLAGIVAGVLAPLAGALVWGSSASPWLRRHIRDAFIHWAIVLALLVGAIALDTMNPVYDFGLVRHAAGALAAAANTLGITRWYGLPAWVVSTVFAILSARRATQGRGAYYPFTIWWESPSHSPDEAAVETMELERR